MIKSSHLLAFYPSTGQKYQEYNQRLERSVSDGQFDRYSKKRQNTIHRYSEKLLRLQELRTQVMLAVLLGALVLNLAPAKAQQLGPFVRNDSLNPFKPPFLGGQHLKPAMVDLDNDGDQDLVVGETSGIILYFENVGSPEKAFYLERFATSNPFGRISGRSNPVPTFSDLDGDGDYDLSVGYENASDALQYFLNSDSDNGTIGDDPRFTEVTFPGSFSDEIMGAGSNHHPTYIDIDGDGDLDIFVGSDKPVIGTSNESMRFYQNNGSSTAPNFELAASLPPGLNDFVEPNTFEKVAPVFNDFDDDGDFDLLVGFGDGTLRYYRNDGNATDPSFIQLTGASNPFDGVDVGFDAAPTLADLDNDGDKDVIVGELTTGIKYFKNEDGTFIQLFTSGNPFEGVDVGSFANPEFVDIDSDGDLDLVIGGHSTSSPGTGSIQYHENVGNGCFEQRFDTDNPFHKLTSPNHQVPEFADLNGDGLPDLLLGLENDILLYLNTGTSGNAIFSASTSPLTLPTSVSRFAPSLSKVDTDVDFDIAVGHSQITFDNLIYYRNDGTPDIPNFNQVLTTGNPFQGENIRNFPVPEFVDIDHDGDEDMFTGLQDGSFRFYEKTAPGTFERSIFADNPLDPLVEDSDLSPAFADIDQDGDLDVFIGVNEGFIVYYENKNEPPTIDPAVTDVISVLENSSTTIDEDLELQDDTDDDIIEAQVIIENFEAGFDFLTFTPAADILGNFDSSTGILMLTGRASLSDYEDVLQSIEFETTSDNPETSKTITFKVYDFDATDPNTELSSLARYDIEIQPVNDPPVLTLGLPAQVSYTENEPAVLVAPGLTLSDPDDDTLQEVSVALSVNYSPGQDLLEFTNQNGITGTFDDQNGTMTLSGPGASVQDFEAALRAVTFRNTSEAPTTGTRTLAFMVSDLAASTSVTRPLEVIPVNDLPVLDSPNSGLALEYTSIAAPLVIDSDLTVSDLDHDNLQSAEVVITGGANGDFLEVTVNGTLNVDFDDQQGILSITGSATKESYQQTLRSVIFTSDGTNSGIRTITFRINDGQDDSAPYSRDINVITEIEVFNAISPNGDDKNQFLEIAGLSTPNKVEIYNRWGDLVYETNDYDNNTNRFEGDSDRGNELPSGTYYYKIMVQDNEYTGYLVLKR